jgi:signal peptidase I
MKRPVRFVTFGFVVGAIIVAQPYRFVMVDGASMSPTYPSGSLVITSRFDSSFHHGDAVVFQHGDETLVKRVAFVPGDRILQFKFLGDWHVPQTDFMVQTVKRHGFPERLWTVPSGQLFVLGDNYYQSVDSRMFGTISTGSVLGRVVDRSRPDLIRGYAGTAQLDDQSSQYVLRKQPLPPKDEEKVQRYYASLERRPRKGRS